MAIIDGITQRLGDAADNLLNHKSTAVDRGLLHLPGPDIVDRVYAGTDRSPWVLRNLQGLVDHGRLGGRVTCRSGTATRASSTPQVPASRSIPPTSIPTTSSG